MRPYYFKNKFSFLLKPLVQALFFICCSMQFANAQSGGARGGGTGIWCDGSARPITLEEFMIQKLNLELPMPAGKMPTERSLIAPWFAHQLHFNREFAENLNLAWQQVGAYDDWKPIHAQEISEALVGGSVEEDSTLLTQMKKLLASLGIPEAETAAPVDKLVGDDYFEIPANCKKVQLSMIVDGTVKKNQDLQPSEMTKRFLELHEALYFLGMSQYQHVLPYRSREVLIQLARSDRSALKEAVRRFMKLDHSPTTIGKIAETLWRGNDPTLDDHFIGYNKVLVFKGFGGMSPGGQGLEEMAAYCPLAISFAADGKSRRAIFLERRDGKMISSTLEGSKVQYGTDSGLSFYQGENSVFPGHDDALVRMFNTVSLFLMSKEAAKMDVSPLPHDLRDLDNHKAISVSCEYAEVNFDSNLDSASLLKIWNSVLLSH
jgi:hypothetical protein